MYTLDEATAITLVRKNFDEQKLNDSDMTDLDDIDSNEFEEILAKNLPEAINAVHAMAPLSLLDGERLDEAELSTAKIDSYGVLSFGVKKDILRLIAFQAADSPYVISEAVSEYSAEGRMQLNPYTRGTSDRPRLVLLQGKAEDYDWKTESSETTTAETSESTGQESEDSSGTSGQESSGIITSEPAATRFRYYSLDSDVYTNKAQAIKRFEYIPTYRYADDTTSYKVADNVIENVIDQLTGMMLVTYNNSEKATYFFTKAGFGPTSSTTAEQN